MKIRKLNSFLLVGFVLLSSSLIFSAVKSSSQDRSFHFNASAVEIFVSPEKIDQPDGTLEKPFNSLIDARNYIRFINAQGNKKDIVVYLRGGTYRLDETVEFNSRDSAEKNMSITYKSYPGEKAVITGNRVIKDWKKGTKGIWQADADFNFRQLYVDGKPATRARTPNDSFFKLKGWDLDDMVLLADTDISVGKMKDLSGVELRMQHVWADTNLRIKDIRINKSRARIIPKEPERTLLFERSHPKKKKGLAFHFENSMEFLDKPGEFYLDIEKNKVFYMPLKDQNMNKVKVEAPLLKTLLNVKGTLDEPVKNIRFRDLVFEGTTWLKVDDSGLLTLQAGMYNLKANPQNEQYAKRQPAMVYVAGARNLSFEENIFRNTGAAGLDFHYGTRNCKIIGNVFVNTAGNGIQHSIFSKPEIEIHIPYDPEDEREICKFDKIENNYFNNIAWYYYGSVAIGCGYPMGIEIEHNEIENTSYTGISVGWGWLYSKPNPMQQNKIRYNHIHETMTRLADGGAIYTLSPQPDSEIAYNYIHDVAPSANVVHGRIKGIYLDEGSDGFTIHHNAVYDASFNYFRHRTGPQNIFHNNHRQLEEGIPEFHNKMLKEIKEQAGLEPAYEHIKKPFE